MNTPIAPRIPLLLLLTAAGCKTTVNVGELTDTAADTESTSDDSTSTTQGSASTGDTTSDTSTTEGTTTGPDTTGGTTTLTTTGSTTTDGSTTQGSTTDNSTTQGSTTDNSTTDNSTTDNSTTQGSTTQGSTTDASTTDGTTTDASTTDGMDPGCGDVPADMACVPANTYEMGTDLNTFDGWNIFPQEKPAHTVTISKSFWMDLTEVTVEDYAVCWALKVCELPMQGKDLNWGIAGKEKFPANGINWYQAKTYCEWKGKRLPTEAEWELAARGTDGRMFPWGNETATCEHVVSNSCGTSGTQAVGTKPLGASPYGLFNMADNVREWCSDLYQEDYYYVSPEVDPQGPMTGTDRSIRSFGFFTNEPSFYIFRVILRGGASPLLNNINPASAGVRCAQTPP